MNLKSQKVQQYWGNLPVNIDYSQIDQSIIKEFNGSHPKIISSWLPKSSKVFKADSEYKLSSKQKKHRLLIKLEDLFGMEFSKKHYKLVK